MKNKKVLLVEDDLDLGNMLEQYLIVEDYDVVWKKNGEEALQFIKEENNYDLILLDVMMPKIDGFTLVNEHKIEKPFLFLTAKNLKEDMMFGLKMGAEDYITKPFDMDILLLKMENILKRNQKEEKQIYSIGKYQFEKENFELKYESESQVLTEKEAELIDFLYQNKNELLQREFILKQVWGSEDFFTGRSMDVFLSRLRKYFKKDENIEIKSIRNRGLIFIVRD
ncbi:response regulator transcription factor [Aureivirga sp. CE67]|uniref:response regulator transcription factor n=1 Tax=Aureivirga sp. CE67 TaxID=1788983 RepID=UPI0018CA316B|nr:response regulator transcription factor [Aureivirga sp. CE67]